jgi:hypothetical protein
MLIDEKEILCTKTDKPVTLALFLDMEVNFDSIHVFKLTISESKQLASILTLVNQSFL